MLVTCLKCNRQLDTGEAAAGEVVSCACGMAILVPELPRAAGKMSCPACGAPVDPQLRKCTYCDARLATVICPRCFGVVFDGSRHCGHCGEDLTGRLVIHHGDATERACPRCASKPPLRVEVVAGFPLERCPECEGLWVDRETVEKIYQDRDRREAVSQVVAATHGAKPPPIDPPKTEGYIACPVCGKHMNRQNFGRFSGVVIDLCKTHGSWFDADELRRILTFISSGGLSKAAAREKEELKEELRWLRQKRAIEDTSDQLQVSSGMGRFEDGGGGRFALGNIALGLVGSLFKKIFGG